MGIWLKYTLTKHRESYKHFLAVHRSTKGLHNCWISLPSSYQSSSVQCVLMMTCLYCIVTSIELLFHNSDYMQLPQASFDLDI